MIGAAFTLGVRVDSASIEAMKHRHAEAQSASREASSSME